jgi:hypothetical protein
MMMNKETMEKIITNISHLWTMVQMFLGCSYTKSLSFLSLQHLFPVLLFTFRESSLAAFLATNFIEILKIILKLKKLPFCKIKNNTIL